MTANFNKDLPGGKHQSSSVIQRASRGTESRKSETSKD